MNNNKKLLLIYKQKGKKPVGTGFFVTEHGHFITALHVVGGKNFKKHHYRCFWNNEHWPIKYDESLSDSNFYYNLIQSDPTQRNIRHDLIILQIDKPNQEFQTEFFSLNLLEEEVDFQASKVFYEGFNVETTNNTINTVKRHRQSLPESRYNRGNGTYIFKQSEKVCTGFSGSPVFLETTGEAIGVVIQRSEDDNQIGAVQSIAMLASHIKAFEDSLYNQLLSLDSLYQKYRAAQLSRFKEESNWPYAIGKDVFVSLFEFNTYTFDDINTKKSNNYDCVKFLTEKFQQKSAVFCTGFYGMGKTTIAKHFFDCSDECVIFMSLSGISLTRLTANSFKEIIIEMILSMVIDSQHIISANTAFLKEHLTSFFNNNQILLILDGIDEAIHADTSLNDFVALVKSLPQRFLLTCRKEFYAFFDTFEGELESKDHIVMELLPWRENQWSIYTEKLKEKYTTKTTQIDRLFNSLKEETYGKLPERPLFLKMISDLELEETMGLEISQELRSNRSYIYMRYINWKIENDYARNKKNARMNKKYFASESFVLFREVAKTEYQKSVPKAGVVAFIGHLSDNRKADNIEETYKTAGFTLGDMEDVCSDLKYLTYKKVVKYLLDETTFFSMIYMDNHEQFRFSHKSFCEYLFAHSLAESLFNKKFDKQVFSQLWDTYQTHEVSTHFKDEVKRLEIENNLDKINRNQYIQTAFESVLLSQQIGMEYSELLEELLYYTGYFKLKSSAILNILKRIITNNSSVHPVYYRTASLSLAMVEKTDYCIDYVCNLIDSYNQDVKQEAFLVNRDIQINYYGKANLHINLKKNIDSKLFKEKKLEDVIPLKIFTYFACLPFKEAEFQDAKLYLEKIQYVCKEKYSRMNNILKKTASIMEKNFHDNNE